LFHRTDKLAPPVKIAPYGRLDYKKSPREPEACANSNQVHMNLAVHIRARAPHSGFPQKLVPPAEIALRGRPAVESPAHSSWPPSALPMRTHCALDPRQHTSFQLTSTGAPAKKLRKALLEVFFE
jgi:hypothetical protein